MRIASLFSVSANEGLELDSKIEKVRSILRFSVPIKGRRGGKVQ